jgi:hypothetical protein
MSSTLRPSRLPAFLLDPSRAGGAVERGGRPVNRVKVIAVRLRFALCAVLSAWIPASAAAQDAAPPAAPAGGAELSPDAHIEINTAAPSDSVTPDAPGDTGPAALAEAPPPRPRKKGLVLESTIGVLGFAGQFRHIAPPAYWLHAQLGYEVLPWLMLFGEGELAFTDSGESQDESHSMAFPIYGFGGGARATFHASPRFAVFGQGEIDALSANVPLDSLAILGFRNAESLAPSFGVRLGAEWYQIDRHLALSAQIGGRDATGFAKVIAASDTPIMWDAALGLRYTF